MTPRILSGIITLLGGLATVMGQVAETGAPIYRVTVIERTIKAVNYRYRSEPTAIDFRGTVLLSKGKGRAIVASKQGRTEIDASFDHLTPPTPFGGEYLTYVLWALTPDGRPHNLGEIIANGSDRASMHVSTDLQAFAMIVTAEPYSAVRQPSDVVVLENQVREDTTGIIEQMNARYELLPRGHYVWEKNVSTPAADVPKISMHEYEMLIEIYQAQNAVGFARAAHADQYAADTLAKAELLLKEAQQRHASKGDRTLTLQEAREAVQTAEDARLISEQKQREENLAKAQADAIAARQAQVNEAAAAAQAKSQAESAQSVAQAAQTLAQAHQAEVESAQIARLRAESEAAAARDQAARTQAELDAIQSARSAPQVRRQGEQTEQRALRARLLQQLNSTVLIAQDTPRGLVITIPDGGFSSTQLRDRFWEALRRVCATLAPQRDLHFEVEGHSDSKATELQAFERAKTVADVMRASGITARTRDFGDQRPLGPNNSAQSRQQNRRIEVIVSGDSIGTTPLWDLSYSLSSH